MRRRKNRGYYTSEEQILRDIEHARQLADHHMKIYDHLHQQRHLMRYAHWVGEAAILGRKLSEMRTPILPGIGIDTSIPK